MVGAQTRTCSPLKRLRWGVLDVDTSKNEISACPATQGAPLLAVPENGCFREPAFAACGDVRYQRAPSSGAGQYWGNWGQVVRMHKEGSPVGGIGAAALRELLGRRR